MSAICGIYRRDGGEAEASTLAKLLHAMRHRGPDGRGEWNGGSVRLGHLLLETTPESRGEKQPLHDLESGRTIAADARIDNRDELMSALGFSPRDGEAATDCALILAAHAKWGERCPEHIVGDFVFAIWDESRKRLFCARDAIGMRVLYLYRDRTVFAFASELTALLALPEVPRELNEIAIGEFLIWKKDEVRATFYRGVERLPPGHTLTVGPEDSSERRYWSAQILPEISYPRDDDYAEALLELLQRAVAASLRTDRPVGVMLSGGLDSSSLAVLAQRGLLDRGSALRAYSSALRERHGGPETDERGFIEAVCGAMGIAPGYVYADRETLIGSLMRMTMQMGQPFPDPFWYMTDALNEAASSDGVRVLMTGIGGDHAASFDGRGHLSSLLRRGRLLELRGLAARRAAFTGRSLAGVLMKEALHPLIPHRLYPAYSRIRGRGPATDMISRSAIREGFAGRIHLRQRVEESRFSRIWRTGSDPRANLKLNMDAGNLANAVESMNLFGGSRGLEFSCPLMDRRVFEFCLALPSGQFVLDGVHRSLLRRAMAGLLPDEVRLRPGKGIFTPDYHSRLLENREAIRSLFHSLDGSQVWEYLDKAKVQDQLDRVRRREPRTGWDVEPQIVLGSGMQLAAFFSIDRAARL